MKFKVNWSSPHQGIQKTTIDAINPFAAREQIKSMYAHIDGFNIISISPISDKKESNQSQSSYTSQSSSGGSSSELSSVIGGGAFAVGFFIALFGLFTLPTGILAMIIGGAVGWVGWKVACWLSDRGW